MNVTSQVDRSKRIDLIFFAVFLKIVTKMVLSSFDSCCKLIQRLIHSETDVNIIKVTFNYLQFKLFENMFYWLRFIASKFDGVPLFR